MEGLLYNVNATDPGTFLVAVILLACIGLFASLPPALRAAAVDPNVALRGD
jgi:ABC-type lipoprotein release transport system permease subunit